MKKRNVLLAAGAALALSACMAVLGGKYQYNNIKLALVESGTARVLVVVQDRRPYVVSGEKNEKYAGTAKGDFGLPEEWRTASGKPLAEDFADVISRALAMKGHGASFLRMDVKKTPEEVEKELQFNREERQLFVAINEWFSDVGGSTDLNYDVALTIRDKQGAVLGQSRIQGVEKGIGGPIYGTGKEFWKKCRDAAENNIPMVYKAKLESLLNDEKIVAALK